MWRKVNAIEGNMSVETLEWESRVRWGIGGRGCKLHWAKKTGRKPGGEDEKINGGREEMQVEIIALHCTVYTAGTDTDRGL